MLRLTTLTRILSSPSTYTVSSLHCLLSAAAAPGISPSPSFAVEDYLIATCGLTRPQARKASGKLSHFKSPFRPDAVLALLAGLGLSSTDVAAVVAKDPQFLCARMEKTLASNVVGLTALGLSRSEIVRLVSLTPASFRSRSIVPKLQYYLPLLGSCENVLRVLKSSSYLLNSSLDRVVKPKVALLQECGLGACDVAKLCLSVPRLLNSNVENVRKMVARAEGIGVPRGSGMFRHMLHAVSFLSEEKIAARVDYLKNTFRWSDAEVCIAVCKAPMALTRSKGMLQRMSKFLISEVGLEATFIAHQPVMLGLSLEGRLRPRYYVVKFLKENGLLERDRSYVTIVKMSENVFVEKYICPHKEAAPRLADDYAAACKGKVPQRSYFHEPRSG